MNQLHWLKFLGLASAVVMLATGPVRADVAQVTGVRLNSTDNGLQVILETSSSNAQQVFTTSSNQALIADIINTGLNLPKSGTFRQDNPTTDIASVTVTPLNANSIRVTITGKAGAPKAQVQKSDGGLILNLTRATNTTATGIAPMPANPQNQPDEDATSADAEESQAETDEPIEIKVTGEREMDIASQKRQLGRG